MEEKHDGPTPISSLSMPHFRPLRRACFVPFLESMSDEQKDLDEEGRVAILKEHFSEPGKALQYGPVAAGTRFQIAGIDWKVVSCAPIAGILAFETEIRSFLDPISALSEIEMLYARPAAASLKEELDPDIRLSRYLNPLRDNDQPIHLAQGDSFMVKGVQFIAAECQPANGTIGPQTRIFADGGPLPDMDKIHLLPIYETLPNRDKDASDAEIFDKYLRPYFSGTFRLLAIDQEIPIDGVDFVVVAAEPREGVVSNLTTVFNNGQPLRYDELRERQERLDAEYAARLQQEEDRQDPMMQLMGGRRHMNQRDLQRMVLIQQQLRDRVDQLPENSQERLLLSRVHDVALMALMSRNPGILNNFLQGIQAEAAEPRGASQAVIETLPTRVFSLRPQQSGTPAKTEDEDDHLTCMVCLEEFSEGEELRTLPCFHSFHSPCIDRWLEDSTKCPLCQHPIV